MAVKVSGTTVIDGSRQLANIAGIDATTKTTLESELTNLVADTDIGVTVQAYVAPGTSGNVLTSNGTTWTSQTPTPGYTNANVDTHLNTNTASSGEVLSWTGSDYDWVALGGGDTVGTITGTTLDLSTGNYFNFTPTQTSNTFVFSNPATSGDVSQFTLELTGATVIEGYDLSANANSTSERGIMGTVGRYGLRFGDSGTKVYTCGNFEVKQLNLGTAYQLETATSAQTYSTLSAGFSSQNTDVSFNATGTKMYVLVNGNDRLLQFSLNTAWDISTASYDSVNFLLSSQDSSPFSMCWGDSGSKFYTIGLTTDDIFQYNCSTAYDLSTASYSGNSISADSGTTAYTCIRAKSDGTALFLFGTRSTLDEIRRVNMSTAWDLSTASLSTSKSVASYFGNRRLYSFDFSGTNMTMIGQSPTETTVTDGYLIAERVTLGTTDIPTETHTRQSTTEVSAEGYPYGIKFNDTGTRGYILSLDEDYNPKVTEFLLSTAWDFNTAYSTTRYSLPSASAAIYYGLAIKPDGTKLWVINSSKNVQQWSMSTAWDLSTLSKDATNTTLSATADLFGLHFSSDGTKLFSLDEGATDKINRYDLSTAWDITTQSLNGTSHTFSESTSITAMAISEDGLHIYNADSSSKVREYSLSTAYDLSTVLYVTEKSAAWSGVARSMALSGDGTQLVVGKDLYEKYTHDISSTSAATFTYPASVKWPGGTAPTAPSDGQTDLLEFVTRDGGTTYYAYQKGDNFS